MGVALGGADRHARGRRDLLEREAERVLEHEHARLRGRQPGEAVAEVRAQLGQLGLVVGRATRSHADVLVERVVAARPTARCDVPAGVEGEPVEPGRERCLAAELVELDAELGEGVLGRVARILRVRQDMCGEPCDARLVTRAERLESEWISVFGAFHEDGIAQSVVRQLRLGPQRGTDSTARAQRGLHPASLLAEGWVRARSGPAEHGLVARRITRDDDDRLHLADADEREVAGAG